MNIMLRFAHYIRKFTVNTIKLQMITGFLYYEQDDFGLDHIGLQQGDLIYESNMWNQGPQKSIASQCN